MIKPENREINSLNGITPLLDFLHARIVPPTSLIGSAGSIFSLPGLAIAPSVRKSATRGSKPRPSATTAALPRNERGRHSLLLNGDEGAQGSPNLAKVAFTLAEVLITLGVIGVVAAMTLPTLIQNYRNREVESKLQKIYTVMNQAIKMSEIDNGPKEYWDMTCSLNDIGAANEDCGNNIKRYFLNYLKYLKTEELETSSRSYNLLIYMNDGSLLIIKREANSNNAADFYFYPNAKNFSPESFASREENGRTFFSFKFSPSLTDVSNKYHYQKGFEPYAWSLSEYTKENLTASGNNYSCNVNSTRNVFCTALIYLNGWKIPKDYPFKVK